jgi:hypothetical protein
VFSLRHYFFLLFLQGIIDKEPIGISTVTASSACTVDTIPPMTTQLERMGKPQWVMSELMEDLGVLEVSAVVA